MPTREQIIVGRRLLKRLLPEAIAAAKDDQFRAEATSDISKALMTHLTLANLDALVICEGDKGGWHADVMFRDLPPGFPQVIGTPVREPFATRQAAADTASRLLTFIVRLIQDGEKLAKVDPKFEFHDLVFTLHTDILQRLMSQGIGLDLTAETARTKLRELDNDHGVINSAEEFSLLPESVQQLYMARIHMAAALGLFRYPENEPQPPAAETSFN